LPIFLTCESADFGKDGSHLNPAGTVHGGLAAPLLDSCMGLAIRSTIEKDINQTAIEFKISLVRPITLATGLIRAKVLFLNCSRRIGIAPRKNYG
jgi:uncharacterized protein (TIGR00369 family)